jgi:hypothetical protein
MGEFDVDLQAFRSEFDDYRELIGGDYPIVYVDIYSRAKVQHSVLLLLTLDEETNAILIQIRFDSHSSLPSPPKKFLTPVVALESLSSLIGEITFNTRTEFIYDSLEFKSTIPLPVRLGNDQSSHIDEIRGFRLVKVSHEDQSEDQIEYSAIIDIPTTDKLELTISKTLSLRPIYDEVQERLESVISLSNLFINKR